MGNVDLSDEHICVVGDKAKKIRSVRRRPEGERWDRNLISGIKVNPWGSGGGLTVERPTRRRHLTLKLRILVLLHFVQKECYVVSCRVLRAGYQGSAPYGTHGDSNEKLLLALDMLSQVREDCGTSTLS